MEDYIIQDALILIPVLLVIGKMLKSTPKLPNWTIPYGLLIIGVILANGVMGPSVDAVIQGVLVAGAAVFGNQLFKQAKEVKKHENK